LCELSKPGLKRMGKVALDVFNAGFQLPDCYSRWSELTNDVLVARSRSRRSKVHDSSIDPITVQLLEEL
jgi:hypothetical protein